LDFACDADVQFLYSLLMNFFGHSGFSLTDSQLYFDKETVVAIIRNFSSDLEFRMQE